MVTLYLVRHGYSVANDQKFFAGNSDVELSDIGKQQAKLVSDYILNNLKIDKIYSSSLSRAYDTIFQVGEGFNLPIIKNTAFNEIYGGEWEMLTFEQVLSNYYSDFICWKNNIYESRCTGGEGFKDVITRAYSELKKIAENNNGKNILIGTHAGVIRAIITAIKNLSAEECNSLGWVSNASLTTIIYQNEKFEIKQTSYDEYLNGLSTSLPKNI